MDLRERVLKGLECCINEQRTVPECERCPYAEIGGTCTSLHKLHADAVELIRASEPTVNGVWEYYTNDEGKARWKCTRCGKLCRRNPHDKARCSNCGAHMRLEA